MRTVIIDRPPLRELPGAVWDLLPFRLADEIRAGNYGEIEEIHLRRGRCASLTVGEFTRILNYAALPGELDEIVSRACDGSLYAHFDTINQGYIVCRGVRIGICGRASLDGGHIIGVRDIGSLVIRVPRPTPQGIGSELAQLIRSGRLCGGALVYAPPGVGKTTVLRGAAACLSSGERPLKVAVVDSRFELGLGLDAPRLMVDVLSGYPKELGISISVRTLAAQVIVCDEIGGTEEAEAILSAHNCGVPLLACTHAANLRELMGKPGIGQLHRAGCFSYYVGLSRREGRFCYNYDVQEASAADAYL